MTIEERLTQLDRIMSYFQSGKSGFERELEKEVPKIESNGEVLVEGEPARILIEDLLKLFWAIEELVTLIRNRFDQ